MFPSGHVLYVSVCGMYLAQLYPNFNLTIILVSMLIIVSTLFTKQHYFVDVPVGLIWALGSRVIAKFIAGV